VERLLAALWNPTVPEARNFVRAFGIADSEAVAVFMGRSLSKRDVTGHVSSRDICRIWPIMATTVTFPVAGCCREWGIRLD